MIGQVSSNNNLIYLASQQLTLSTDTLSDKLDTIAVAMEKSTAVIILISSATEDMSLSKVAEPIEKRDSNFNL
ncbi:MAG: hypothetical protein WBB23_00995 [Desulforhopalus sp.]